MATFRDDKAFWTEAIAGWIWGSAATAADLPVPRPAAAARGFYRGCLRARAGHGHRPPRPEYAAAAAEGAAWAATLAATPQGRAAVAAALVARTGAAAAPGGRRFALEAALSAVRGGDFPAAAAALARPPRAR